MKSISSLFDTEKVDVVHSVTGEMFSIEGKYLDVDNTEVLKLVGKTRTIHLPMIRSELELFSRTYLPVPVPGDVLSVTLFEPYALEEAA